LLAAALPRLRRLGKGLEFDWNREWRSGAFRERNKCSAVADLNPKSSAEALP
jgi:hypothetical protein